jgi:hypothetical protein
MAALRYNDLWPTSCSMTKTCQPHMAEARVLHNPSTDAYNQTGQEVTAKSTLFADKERVASCSSGNKNECHELM